MRSMDEDCGGDLSEDEHPSTDASEDSVEVHVKPISSFPSNLSRLPRKFRKAFENKNSLPDVQEKSPEVKLERTSPSQFLISDRHKLSCSPINFSTQTIITTGRASPPTPQSPPAVPLRARGNKRKLLEPRRVIETSVSHDEEWTSPRKAQRVEQNLVTPSVSSPQAFLRHNPFIGHLVPPQLLVSQSVWNPVAQYPYSHLVGLAPQLSFLPSSPYPLLPLLPPRLPLPQVASHKSHSEDKRRSEKGHPQHNDGQTASSSRMNGISISLSKISPTEEVATSSHSSVSDDRIVQSHQKSFNLTDLSPKKSYSSRPKNFLSVESLISSREKCSTTTEIVKSQPLHELTDDDQDVMSTEGTIQSLLQNQPKQKQRNYKNMTRERRIEANARERTRVHTISAAFETLRQAVPSFSHNQKLSKLSVLRIASAYILSLSRLAGQDYSLGETSPTFEECVDLTTKTIQIEGKAKKKRED